MFVMFAVVTLALPFISSWWCMPKVTWLREVRWVGKVLARWPFERGATGGHFGDANVLLHCSGWCRCCGSWTVALYVQSIREACLVPVAGTGTVPYSEDRHPQM